MIYKAMYAPLTCAALFACARSGTPIAGLPPDSGAPAVADCKRGAGYVNENGLDVTAFSKGIGWWYDWDAIPNASAHAALSDGGVEYVPMVWTGPPNAAIDVQGLIQQIPAEAQFLLGFNEPNFGTQANLTPAQAAAAWPQLEQIAQARNLKLVAPAVNYCGGNCNETDPFVWLDAFIAACTNCQVDYIAFHWYACSQDALTGMLKRFESYGRPVWLTEFACLDDADTSEAAQEAYMKAAVPVLEADPKVFRYAWFIGRSSPGASSYDLLSTPGTLSPLGNTYVGFSGACVQ
jgi:Glycosyl hydrolase catalytic core